MPKDASTGMPLSLFHEIYIQYTWPSSHEMRKGDRMFFQERDSWDSQSLLFTLRRGRRGLNEYVARDCCTCTYWFYGVSRQDVPFLKGQWNEILGSFHEGVSVLGTSGIQIHQKAWSENSRGTGPLRHWSLWSFNYKTFKICWSVFMPFAPALALKLWF